MEQQTKDLRFTVAESVKNQAEYCKKKGYPRFAPGDGFCWDCRKNIYEHPKENGGLSHVTGCPWCHWSFCE